MPGTRETVTFTAVGFIFFVSLPHQKSGLWQNLSHTLWPVRYCITQVQEAYDFNDIFSAIIFYLDFFLNVLHCDVVIVVVESLALHGSY